MEAGTPDILACIPVKIYSHIEDDRHSIVGLFVGIETKMPEGGQPTAIQNHRHRQIHAAGGVVLVVRSVSEAVQALEALGMSSPPTEPS